jgi:thioredoxin-like negative regulator of GroEL
MQTPRLALFVLSVLCTALSAFESSTVSADGKVVEQPLIVELHKNNFDAALKEHDEVLVHFYAPWSKRCETMQPYMEAVARDETWGSRMKHARSDISDPDGHTSYIELHGVLKLPTIVLFRNGHAYQWPLDSELTHDSVVKWLQKVTEQPMQPRPAKDFHAKLHGPVDREEMIANKAKREADQREALIDLNGEEAVRKFEAAAAGGGGKSNVAGQPTADGGYKSNVKASAMRRAQERGAEAAPAAEAEAAEDEGVRAGRRLGEIKSDEEQLASQETDAVAGMAADAASETWRKEGFICAALDASASVSDGSFEKTVMDKAKDVFVLFYKPSAAFCEGGGAEYGGYAAELVEADTSAVVALRMDLTFNKSPFVFEDSELPVVMLFPAKDKRPLEFDEKLTRGALHNFAANNGGNAHPD